MKYKSLPLLLVLLVSLAVVPDATATAPLETLLPADTYVALVIEDVPGFLAAWPETPWGKLWADTNTRNAMNPFLEEMNESEDKVAVCLELLNTISGQAALVAPDLSQMLSDGNIGGSWALVAEFSDEGISLIKELTEDTNNDLGEDLYLESGDGATVIGKPKEYVVELKKMIWQKSGSKLSDTATIKKMRERNPKTDAYIYFNLEFLSRAFDHLAGKKMPAEPDANMMGITSEGVLNALALDALDGAYVTTQQLPRETVMDMGILIREIRGITKLMASPPGPCAKPAFIPEDVLMVSVTRMSFPDIWAGLLDMTETMSPGVGEMLETQLQQISMSMGVDVEKDILENFGNDFFSAYLSRPNRTSGEEMDQVMGITVNDSEALQNAMDTIMGSFGGSANPGMMTEEYSGTTIHYQPGDEEEGFAYALTDEYLVVGIGSIHGVKTLLKGMDQTRGKSIWDRKDLKPLFAELPRDAYSVGYTDMSALARIWFDSALKMEAMDNPGPEDSDLQKLAEWKKNLDWMSFSKFFGPMMSASTQNDDGFYSTLRMIHPE